MEPHPSDVIANEPRPSSWPPIWTMAVIALFIAALAAAITIAVHYRGEVTSLRRELRSLPVPRPPGIIPLALSATTASLPSSDTLHGQVTVISAWRSGGQTQIEADAHVRDTGLP